MNIHRVAQKKMEQHISHNTVKPLPEAHMDMILFEEHRLDSTTTDITTALFIL